MISRLTIKNFALLKDSEVVFKSGFNIITGETGSGKSLILSALSFLGGKKTGNSILRDQSSRAFVEAEIIPSEDKMFILRRELDSQSRSRAYMDDSPIPLKALTSITKQLFDITSQRAFSHLLDPILHLDFLDLFSKVTEKRGNLASLAKEHLTKSHQLKAKVEEQTELEQRFEIVSFKLNQIEEINPEPDEDQRISNELRRLEHYEDLYQNGVDLVDLLIEDDQSANSRIQEALKKLLFITEVDSSLSDLVEELENAAITTNEIARRVSERCLNVEFDSDRIEYLRARDLALKGLIRKYGGSFEALLNFRSDLESQLHDSDNLSSEIRVLRKELKKIEDRWGLLATKVSSIRKSKSGILEKSVINSLSKLGVVGARFETVFCEISSEKNLKIKKLHPRGKETVEFYLSTNPGIETRPLVEVASGGELSRLLLSLKEALPVTSAEATIVLDEIDSGVSGRVASLVGKKLSGLSKNRQIIAITHLPQIAGLANQHYKVSKKVINGKMESRIDEISGDVRTVEIARLLSAGKVTDAARKQAQNLLMGEE